MKKPNIVLVGHVCIDQNTTENASYTGWGSSVLYIDQFMRKEHDVSPAIITQYGPDLVPYVPTARFIPAEPTQPKSLSYENDTRSTPRIWRCHNTEFAGEPELTSDAVAALNQADIVVVATLLPNYSSEFIARLMRHVRPEALTVLCPQGYFRHITPEGLVVPRDFTEAVDIVPAFDIVIYSEEDNPEAFAFGTKWAQTMEGHIVITQGDKGASIVTRDGITQIPTQAIPANEIIDSVGCGDTFAATVAYSYYETHDLKTAVETAHVAAARKLRSTPEDK